MSKLKEILLKRALAKGSHMGSFELTERYRKREGAFMTSSAHREAYITVRMPATFAAISRTFLTLPNIEPLSLKDLGAGPGTATWAAVEYFPSLKRWMLYERDGELLRLGKELMRETALEKADWFPADLLTTSFEESDLTILSYVTNEMEEIYSLIERAWNSTTKLLLVIEPGTPLGFEKIRAIRTQLLGAGGYLVAPCPHSKSCPMSRGDWCHFAARLERSRQHQQMKEATRGFEDEKFSFVAFSKMPYPPPSARILRHPEVHSGHLRLTLCKERGIEQETFSKKQGALYKTVRKLNWGDSLNALPST